jgi:hypothetical protein
MDGMSVASEARCAYCMHYACPRQQNALRRVGHARQADSAHIGINLGEYRIRRPRRSSSVANTRASSGIKGFMIHCKPAETDESAWLSEWICTT